MMPSTELNGTQYSVSAKHECTTLRTHYRPCCSTSSAREWDENLAAVTCMISSTCHIVLHHMTYPNLFAVAGIPFRRASFVIISHIKFIKLSRAQLTSTNNHEKKCKWNLEETRVAPSLPFLKLHHSPNK